MIKVKKMSAKLLICMLALILSAGGMLGDFGLQSASALVESVGGSDSLVRTSLAEINNILTSVIYSEYISLYGNVKAPDTDISIPLEDYVKKDEETESGATTTLTAYIEDNIGGEDSVLVTADDGKITWNLNIEEDCLYSIKIEYYTGNISVKDTDGNIVSEGKSSAIERILLIDNKVPFKEARSIMLPRRWADEYTLIDKEGNKKKILSNSDEFIDFVTKYENNKKDSERLFLQDTNGNEIKPEKKLISAWNEVFLYDSSGYYNNPLKFYFEKGEHTLTLQTVKEPLAIKSITLTKADEVPTYDEYLENHNDASDYTGDSKVMIQAEYPNIVSERTIYQLNDRSSTITIPQDPAKIRTNQIGGDKWQYVGQWIEWTVDIPEDGFYSIIPRSKQDIYAGMYVSRRIYINGTLPFEEASYLRFNFSDNWVTNPLNDGNRDFKFYFNKGLNVIRMEVVLGRMSEVLSSVENSLNVLNGYYRKILMITGPTPDEYRDFHFEKLIPDVIKGLVAQAEILDNVSKLLQEITGEKGEHAASLDKVAVYVDRMGTYPQTIAGSMSTLKDYLGSLGSWLTDTQNQPLYIDYLCIQAVDAELPQAEPGFFQSVWGEIQKFYMSFFADYNSIGSLTEQGITSEDLENVAIEVWTATSREQAQIIRSLVDDNFSLKYNIPVTVKLVVGGTLLPATLAGTGPDINMGSGQGDPVNFAIRSAIKSLNTNTGDTNIGYNFNDFSQWEDHPIYSSFIDNIEKFDEVKKRFAPAAMRPITLYGETYALPENMNFPMMFYRKDIFAELGINVPNTWDEFYDIIYTLQSNKLEIGFPSGTTIAPLGAGGLPVDQNGFILKMYQQNEDLYDMGNYEYYLDLYKENGYSSEDLLREGWAYYDEEGNIVPKTDGMTINLDSDIALASFKEISQLFTMYDFPVQFSFPNRFRQGSMPLGVMDYVQYNQMIVFAPEIRGLWEFTPLPGILKPDGTIDNTTVATVSTMIMMRSVTDENALAAWTYMQWWTSAEAQSAYGNEMVALLGPSAKQNTANIEALTNMAWSKDEYDNLRAQFNAVDCTPEFPGSYIIARYTTFAFLDVYNKDAEPIEKLRSYIKDINSEFSRKRKEFNLPVAEDFVEFERNKQKEG